VNGGNKKGINLKKFSLVFGVYLAKITPTFMIVEFMSYTMWRHFIEAMSRTRDTILNLTK